MSLPVVAESIESYLADIGRFPLLTKDEEYALAVDYQKTRDLDAAHKLVTSNLRFVIKIAMEFRGYGVSLKDLIQEGNVGLMTAVKKFDPTRGFRLITYAVWWIKSCIQDMILKSRGMVKRHTKALKRKLFYRNADALGPGDENAQAALKALPSDVDIPDFSLDMPLGEDANSTHLDMLVDTTSPRPEAMVENRERSALKDTIATALATLNDRERLVMKSRVMADDPQSLQSLGERLGLTRERVRQIEKGALEKLRKCLPANAQLALPSS